MPIYAASKEHFFDEIRNTLANLLRNFDADPAASREQIRDLLESDRELFCGASVEILKTAGDSRGMQHLVALLASSGALVQALCDPYLNLFARYEIAYQPAAATAAVKVRVQTPAGWGEMVIAPPREAEV